MRLARLVGRRAGRQINTGGYKRHLPCKQYSLLLCRNRDVNFDPMYVFTQIFFDLHQSRGFTLKYRTRNAWKRAFVDALRARAMPEKMAPSNMKKAGSAYGGRRGAARGDDGDDALPRKRTPRQGGITVETCPGCFSCRRKSRRLC